jgi:putative ABC transport system permease protein
MVIVDWTKGMLKNYLKIALRNILRQPRYSFINIFGMSVGIACCILILLFVRYELSYDRFNANADRIYRVTRQWFNEDGSSSLHLARVAPPIGPLLKNDYPNIVLEEARFAQDYNTYLEIKNNPVIEKKLYWAEPSALKMFTIPFIEGDPKTALNEPNTLVITQSAAKKYFGDEDPMGRTIRYEHQRDLKITGVVKDVPENSFFHYDFLGSFVTLYDSSMTGREELEESWSSNNYLTFLLVPKNLPIKQLEAKIPGFIDTHLSMAYKKELVPIPARAIHNYTTLHLQKLTDIHLLSHLTTEVEENGDIKNVYIFSAVALFILLIACINFMNLSTARSAKRAREIGVRKVMGAYRKQLMGQFIGESMLTVLFSLVISVIIVEVAVKPFSVFAKRDLHFDVFSDPVLAIGIIVLTVLVGFLSGSYPAVMLSSFRPSVVLKGGKIASRKSAFRTALVVFQFAISVGLITAMGVVFQQMEFVNNKNLGYSKDHIVLLPMNQRIRSNLESFKSQLLLNPGVRMVATSRLVPSNMLINDWGAKVVEGKNAVPITFRLAVDEVDYDFLKTYQIPLTAGRDFSRDHPTDDSAAFILNETAVRQLEWTPQEAIGKPMIYGGRNGRVIGVVHDFNFESLHNEIVPILFLITQGGNTQVAVRISGKDIPSTLAFLKSKWAEYRPDYPFDYRFLDDQLATLYVKDEKIGDVFGIFAVIAVLVACLGLFGLASFSVEQRRKEIGIRKVLGASISNVLKLISREFVALVLVANLIAWPAAYFIMNKWLNGFAYRVQINPLVFLFSGGVALIIAMLTVGWLSIKAATANPAESLRYE